jgi:nitrogen regulatory protein P-II 1
MKELDVFIRSEHRSKMTDILQKNREGISFFEVRGTGSTPSAAPEVVHTYGTGRTTVTEFVTRLLVMTVVPDSSAKKIVDELIDCFGDASEPYGVLFVKDVTSAYQLGSKLVGDEILTPNELKLSVQSIYRHIDVIWYALRTYELGAVVWLMIWGNSLVPWFGMIS